jgi:hypothetical protein
VQELAYPLLRQAHHEPVSILEAITRREGARAEAYMFLASRTNAKAITGPIVTVDAG